MGKEERGAQALIIPQTASIFAMKGLKPGCMMPIERGSFRSSAPAEGYRREKERVPGQGREGFLERQAFEALRLLAEAVDEKGRNGTQRKPGQQDAW